MSTIQSVRPVTVRDKRTGAVIAELPRATEADIDAVAADRARKSPWAPRERARVLENAVKLLRERKPTITETMRRETGVTTRDVQLPASAR
jgi:acyl-CoA reductase-like NAD-dependent aldehyde dehydrogenase